MPWIRLNDENKLTSDEFDALVEKYEENGDIELLETDEEVWVSDEDLFDHTSGEIREMEEEDEEEGKTSYGSVDWDEG